MTPSATFTPVAIAVALAAESVTVPTALLWVIHAWCVHCSKLNSPVAPLLHWPAPLTCSMPMPSPMDRITFFGACARAGDAVGASAEHSASANDATTPDFMQEALRAAERSYQTQESGARKRWTGGD